MTLFVLPYNKYFTSMGGCLRACFCISLGWYWLHSLRIVRGLQVLAAFATMDRACPSLKVPTSR